MQYYNTITSYNVVTTGSLLHVCGVSMLQSSNLYCCYDIDHNTSIEILRNTMFYHLYSVVSLRVNYFTIIALQAIEIKFSIARMKF